MSRDAQHQARDVPAEKIRPLVLELERRCGGVKQAAKYIGVSHVTLYNILNGTRAKGGETVSHQMVYQRTARLIILGLYQRRKEDRRNGSSERFKKALDYQAMLEDKMMRNIGY